MDQTKENAGWPTASVEMGGNRESGGATDLTSERSGEDQHVTGGNVTGKAHFTSKMTSFLQRLQRHMAAVAYAEAGEYQSAKELLEPVPRSKTVLLVVEGETPDFASLSHALNLCKRTGGDLDVLQVIPLVGGESHYERLREKTAEGSGHLAALVRQAQEAGVPFRIRMRKGEVNDKLFDYVKRHKDVAMVVLDSPRARAGPSKDKAWARFAESVSQQLSIPLVTVMPKDPEPA